MTDIITLIFSQQFLIRALIVGVLISLCCALLGVSLVLKRFSMIGDGLSHVGFGAMAIACAANIAPLYFSLPIVVAAAFLLLKMNDSGKIKGDAAIALISTGALAVGVMVTSMTTGMNVDIYNYMFGSILTMSSSDVLISGSLSVVVILIFILFYNEIFAVTFDESFAKATGTRVSVYNMLISALTAVTIVIGMRMMGALLISSLIIFPTVSSIRICKSFKKVIISSTIISVVCFLLGLVLSIAMEAPTGASVVCVNIFVLAVLSITKKISESTKIKNVTLKKALCFALCAVSLIFAVMIFSFSDVKVEKKERLSIVTTGFAHYDFAKQICGENAEITMLLSPGEESHTYEPTPSDIMKIQQCDIFIYTGGESETWVDNILKNIGDEVECIKLMDITAVKREVITDEMDHEHDENEHSDHDHEEEYDEHVWTSPVNAIDIVKVIYNTVCLVDSENEKIYIENAGKFITQLEHLDLSFRKMMQNAKQNCVVIADRFPLMYLFDEYGINYHAAFPGCSAQVQANPVTIAFLNDIVNEENIPVIFKVDMSTGTVAKSISESTGADIDTLYSCHTVTQQDFENGETYISLMTKNLTALKKALDA